MAQSRLTAGNPARQLHHFGNMSGEDACEEGGQNGGPF